MTWPELAEALKPLGFVPFVEGNRLYHQHPTNERRVECLGGGQAVLSDRDAYARRLVFVGPFRQVAEYLQKGVRP